MRDRTGSGIGRSWRITCCRARRTSRRSALQGDKRTELIFDGTAIHAVEMLASSLHGMLTSARVRRGFRCGIRNTALCSRNDAANEWLEICRSTRCTRRFTARTSSKRCMSCTTTWWCFGTGGIYLDLSPRLTDLRFATRHIAEICISEDANGRG
jgi:hypothetical protein